MSCSLNSSKRDYKGLYRELLQGLLSTSLDYDYSSHNGQAFCIHSLLCEYQTSGMPRKTNRGVDASQERKIPSASMLAVTLTTLVTATLW